MEMHGTTREESMCMQSIISINQKMPELELRDLFAMSAMNALLPTEWGSETSEKDIARYSYKMADAMLAARKVK